VRAGLAFLASPSRQRSFAVDQQHDSSKDAAPARPQQAQSAYFNRHEIRRDMLVMSAEGTFLGTVQGIEGDEIRLSPGGDAEHTLLPLSLVDGVDDNRVIMRSRGDNAFGMEA
jgi:hypothetical protein